MRSVNYIVAMYEGMGRGLKTLVPITKGSIITECEVLVLSPQDTRVVNTTELQCYTFRVNDLQDCIVLGDGSLFNHADNRDAVGASSTGSYANVGYKLAQLGERIVMQYWALDDIESDTQLFINYSADGKVTIETYLRQQSLQG